MAYHFQKRLARLPAMIPLLYAVAMGVEAITALVFGKLFDRIGITALMFGALLSAASSPLVFLGGFGMAVAGMALWGAGMGAQQALLRAAIANMVPVERRGAAYGIFNTAYGVLWFAGSAAMGASTECRNLDSCLRNGCAVVRDSATVIRKRKDALRTFVIAVLFLAALTVASRRMRAPFAGFPPRSTSPENRTTSSW